MDRADESMQLLARWIDDEYAESFFAIDPQQSQRSGLSHYEAQNGVGDARLFEVHPEVSFARLAGRTLDSSKKSWNGAAQRRALLAGVGIELPNDLGPAGTAPVDDVLDAAVAAWSASRIAAGEAVSLPATPGRRDRSGRLIAIWS